jgi:hypothetical protein
MRRIASVYAIFASVAACLLLVIAVPVPATGGAHSTLIVHVPPASAWGHAAGRTPLAAERSAPGVDRVSSPPEVLNPANCTQGNHTIVVPPSAADMHDPLFNDYQTLGQLGGGTIELETGTYVVYETLNFQHYSNVSIQGAGIGKTVLSLPPNPVGRFAADNGSLVGQFNTSGGDPIHGITANFIQVSGGQPVDDFEMCDLTIDAQANNASEDWSGSLVLDSSGGYHHVYTDIAEAGFFGPSTTPNGMHLESSPSGNAPGVGYVVDHLTASNNSVPFKTFAGYKGGPNFLNVGTIVNCTIYNVSGIGLVAFEVAPPEGCTIENWNISGHILIDPFRGGSWEGTVLGNVTVNVSGTAAPNALSTSVANGTSGGRSNFTALRWDRDRFYGAVLDGVNMVDVENSTFYGGLNSTPARFENNTVVWASTSPNQLSLPIVVRGTPVGGTSASVISDTFVFPSGTRSAVPFRLTAPENLWSDDLVEISGASSAYLLVAPQVGLVRGSLFSDLTYRSLGNLSPATLQLLDLNDSPGFVNYGASVGPLTGIVNNLPPAVTLPATTPPGPSAALIEIVVLTAVPVGAATALVTLRSQAPLRQRGAGGGGKRGPGP